MKLTSTKSPSLAPKGLCAYVQEEKKRQSIIQKDTNTEKSRYRDSYRYSERKKGKERDIPIEIDTDRVGESEMDTDTVRERETS